MNKRDVKIFVSSTFSDMHSERNCLLRRVFPRLQAEFTPANVSITGIDLRWGITQEQCDNDQALSLCMEKVAACDILVCLLGERYGYVPNEQRAGAAAYSITEREILHAVSEGSNIRQSLFFFRDRDSILGHPKRFSHLLVDAAPRSEKLHALKIRIREQFQQSSVFTYSSRFEGLRCPQRLLNQICSPEEWHQLNEAISDGLVDYDEFARLPETLQALLEQYAMPEFSGMAEFEELVVEALTAAIRNVVDTSTREADPLSQEILFQKSFRETRLAGRTARPELDGRIDSFLKNPQEKLMLTGGVEGAGVTTALAYAVSVAQNKGHRVFYYSTGVTGISSDMSVFLEVLNRELATVSGKPLPDCDLDLQSLLREMAGHFNAIENNPQGPSLCLIVDGVDAFRCDGEESGILWLPHRIPNSVKIVIGVNTNSFAGHNILRCLEKRDATVVQIGQFQLAELKTFLEVYPALTAKTLSDDQKLLLTENAYCRHPLFVSVVLQQLQLFGVFNLITRKIEALPTAQNCEPLNEATLQPALRTLIKDFISDLGEEFGTKEASVVVTCLSHSSHGLPVQALSTVLEALHLDGGAAAGVVRVLAPFLVEYHGNMRLSYFVFRETSLSLFDNKKAYYNVLCVIADYLKAELLRKIREGSDAGISMQLLDILDLYVEADQADNVHDLLTNEPTCGLIHSRHTGIASRAWVFLNRNGKYHPQTVYPELSKSYTPDSAEYDGLCHVLWQNCRPKEAYALLESRVRYFKTRNQYLKEHPESLELMGTIACEAGNFSGGFRLLVEGEYLARKARDSNTAAKLIETQAIMEKNRGNLQTSATKHQTALALAPDDPFLLQNIHGNQGITFKHLRNYADAMEHLERQESICRHHHFIGHLANSLINQANVLQEGHEDFDGCIAKTREAADLFAQIGDYRGYAIALGNAGNAHAHKGEFDQALELFDAQEIIGRNLNLPNMVAFALRGRSLIAARYEKNPIKSKTLLAEANELFRSTGAHHLIVDE